MKDFLEFKWKYLPAKILSFFYPSIASNDELLFVTHEGTKEWILGAKARRLSRFTPIKSKVFYSKNLKDLSDHKLYFFLHQKYFARAIRYNPFVLKRQSVVMFTHAEWSKYYSKRHVTCFLNKADKIICLNTSIRDQLVQLGVDKDRIVVFHLGSDPDFFPEKRKTSDNHTVGFSMAYYERKNPDLMVDIVKNMPDVNFILIGKDWEQYDRFLEIKDLPNFKYLDNVPYEDYPSFYQKIRVFVSPSHLEGGPVPLLEAMLSNVVPVVSNTGFGPDLIRNGENGFLFDSTAHYEDVILLIRKAFLIDEDVRKYALPHSWQNYGKKIADLYHSSHK
jgi:glycosyltransferase involved in cell wall biosynthesis